MLSPSQAKIRSFEVTPSLPDKLQPLLQIAHNLWWSWHPEARDLFVRLSPTLWEESHHNPVLMLGRCPQKLLDEAASDEGFLTSVANVQLALDRHMTRQSWLATQDVAIDDCLTAYFCAEFGLTECLQIYSGGLGCLAGDHLKSAAELALPLVGVGLLYRHGYFQQYLNADGWQQEYTPDLDFANLPVEPVTDAGGEQITVSVKMLDRRVNIAVWKVSVGRVPLYLLDTNLTSNDPADRTITSQLYGGDMELRIRQEIVLGIGGVRALEALKLPIKVFHMNEGHSAFLALERIRRLIEDYDITFDEAREFAASSQVFTTHTPVPAGIDRFPPDMIQRYFKEFHPSLRLDMEGLLALGRENVFQKNEFFSMAVLAIRTADWANGVSRLHGEVSRRMWNGIWPGLPVEEVPIKHVTNGVHARSWLTDDLIYLFDRYLGSRWQYNPADQSVWNGVNEAPDEDLWRLHEHARHRLIVFARRRLREQIEARGGGPDEIAKASEALSINALTVGFARRFATYKRGSLILRDRERLLRMLRNTDRPIQFLIAGKAHPADNSGKEVIRDLVHFARESGARSRMVFLENYDIEVARYLVQGCDLWLNNPRRGMEASGTSGMKAAMNGVLNCSILDGWWDEAYENNLGWAIGRGEVYANPDQQDDIEGRALYDLLEQQILPTFFDRDTNGVPREWVKRMKRCISALAPEFNTNRMLQDYSQKLYVPAAKRTKVLAADKLKAARHVAERKWKLRSSWSGLKVVSVNANVDRAVSVHSPIQIEAVVELGTLAPEDVSVQAYVGPQDNDGRITDGAPVELSHEAKVEGTRHRFKGSYTPSASGRYGLAVRILPGGELIEGFPVPGLLVWDQRDAAKAPESRVAAAATT